VKTNHWGLTEAFDREGLVRTIRDGIVGQDQMIGGPYGPKKVVYADWVASSRALGFLEDYIRDEVLPVYSNTHTTSSTLGHQISLFREEARVIIARTINARDDKDALIFTGSGSTSAVNHLIAAMRLQRFGKVAELPSERPLVLVGPHEHHSNLLPWRESICEVQNIPEDVSTGLIDSQALEVALKRAKEEKRPLVIGSFSAASNITGLLQDCASINRLLHTYGALAFWDFAAAAPYVKVDMNPMASTEADRGLVHMDALFISPHKFPGGTCTPGILVAKKFLFDRKQCPSCPGGGTVEFVTSDDQLYHSKVSEREEAGTPDIVGCIRAGLVFQLKHAVTPELIESLEARLYHKAVSQLSKNPRIHIMGPLTRDGGDGASPRLSHRLPTLSFLIYHQSGKLLHYNFVCALLDNLFGIQSRGGCVCAGPYGEYLLGMDLDLARLYEEQLSQFDDVEVLRPGFVRLSLNYFISDAEAQYVLDALDFIAREGWKLLPQYSFQPETNEWMHLSNKSLPNRKWLGEISYTSGKMFYPKQPLLSANGKRRTTDDLSEQFEEAVKSVKDVVSELERDPNAKAELSQSHELMREEAEELRWFVYPDEAYLHRIDIDEEFKSIDSLSDSNSFHNPTWRSKWQETCPLSPKYYAFHPQALTQAPGSAISSDTTVMPKTHRFTATVTDLDSAIHAKSQFTAKQMDQEIAAKQNASSAQSPSVPATAAFATPIVAPVTEITTAAALPEVKSTEDAKTAEVNFVVPKPASASGERLDSEEQEDRLAEAVFREENEGLASHKHQQDEEDDGPESADFCCPLPANGRSSCSTGVCEVPATRDGRTSVKTVIDQRKAEKNAKRAQKSSQGAQALTSEEKIARDKAQSAVAVAARKQNRIDRFDPIDHIEHRIFKGMVGAIRLFDLIGPGDRVLVGVSGGKDSLTLLQMLLKAQKLMPFKFEVAAVTVDPQTLEFDPSPLKVYMAEIGVKYFYDSQPLISIATDIGPSSICAWCSRMKRGILHNICEREGYNVLALGQHLDDLVESFFMYSFHNGKLDTMKASSVVRNGKVKIIRPFVFVREKDTKHYANLANLPVITENCPACFEEPKERARIKALLKAQERLYPNLFGNLLGAIKPLMHPEVRLDQLLNTLEQDAKLNKSAKYYPNRRNEAEHAAFMAKRQESKKAARQAKQEAKRKNKDETTASSSSASSPPESSSGNSSDPQPSSSQSQS
jgi:selenocysteine lyase/cysteine desulfurase/tRNA(Ile)-lysidine synthase TilS/MesJ